VRIKVAACGICHSDSQVDGRKMMARRIVYGLFPGVAILLAVGAALGQGMQTFTNEQAARRHCPADTVVWLNTSTANYHFEGDPWYGGTQRGSYVCKVEADKDGMRAWTSPK
jgi:threonine dehydrogenase-like Zn-dependent dehydrogenase